MIKMINKRILPILFIMILVLNCKKDLKESERNWNPYTLNEVLVFESSEKQLDTIIINKIKDDVISASPTPELYRYKSLYVFAKQWNTKYNKYWNNKILDIPASTPTPDKPAEIGFPLYFENAKFAGWGFKIEELNKYPTMSVTTKAGTFNDVIKLESVMYRPKRKNSVKFMYWSKKEGYIKFERADGFTWELIEKRLH